MKQIKLIPVEKEPIKNKYIILVKFMHGDADGYTEQEYECDDENDLRRIVDKLDNIPQVPAEGGDEDVYDAWELDTFNSDDFIPYDQTGYDCKASYDRYEAFYHDENGVEFRVELE